MAKKYFEQMLMNELELRRATTFPKWYAAPNPMYYGLCDTNQDYRNVARLNRQDLYSVEYYRQPFWVPQSLVFPNYEPFCLIRRNNKRFFNGKNHFSRDKRSNVERKFFRQEDTHNYRGERGKSLDFQPVFERSYQEGWNRDGPHYQLPPDGRNASYIMHRNSNFDLNSENISIEQHLQNIKQMLENRNPSTECLSAHENLPQTEYSRNENSVQADSQNHKFKATDIEWQDQADRVSKNTDSLQHPESLNFNNNHESWYCPEEQQQIIDMLKEVNLRHDRQLKRDMLLSQSGQLGFVYNINESQKTECQTSFSSEDEEDNINIILYPENIPPIPEVIEENEEFEAEYNDKSANDFFEEFQNIFIGSPEKKIINLMIKETNVKKSQTVEDSDLENTKRIITEDDKNAVKTILDFDHVEDLTEKTFDECTSNILSTSKEITSDAKSATTVNKQYATYCEEGNVDKKSYSIEMVLDSDYMPLVDNTSYPRACSEIKQARENSLLEPSKNSSSNKKPQRKNPENSGIIAANNSFNSDDFSNGVSCITPSPNNIKCKEVSSGRKNIKNLERISEDLTQINQMEISKDACDNISLKENIHKEKTKNQYNSCTKPNTTNAKQIKAPVLEPCNENINENANKIKSRNETRNSQNNIKSNLENTSKSSSSNRTLKKEECGLSVSEPFLYTKKNYVGYRKISVSEIFSSVTAKSRSPNHHHITHLIDPNMDVKDLTPSEHLKLILGIGQNHIENKPNCQNTFTSATNKAISNDPRPTNKLKTNSLSEISEVKSKCIQEQDSLRYPYCMPTHVSTGKVILVRENDSKTPLETTKIDLPIKYETIDKNKKLEKNTNSCIDLNGSKNPQNVSNLDNNINVCATMHKKKQKNRKSSLKKETFSDKEKSSIINCTEQRTNQNDHFQTNTFRFSESRLKCNPKVTFYENVKSHVSFDESENNNDFLLNDDSKKKSKKEQSKSSKFSDQKKSVRSNEVSMIFQDPSLPVNIGESHDDISSAVNFNVNSSNSKNMYSSYHGRKKYISNSESSMDYTYSTSSSSIDKNVNSGMHFKQNYPDVQVSSSKYFRQKSRRKSNESFTNHSDTRLSESNETISPFASVDSKSHYPKSNATKHFQNKMFFKNKVSCESLDNSQITINAEKDIVKASSAMNTKSDSSKTRKKNRKKRKENAVDKSENLSKPEQYNEPKQNNTNFPSNEIFCTKNETKGNNLVKICGSLKENFKASVNGVVTENASINSEVKTNSFNFETNIKEKYSKKASDSDVFLDDKVFVSSSDVDSRKCNESTKNVKVKNSNLVSKRCRFKDSETNNDLHSQRSISHKEAGTFQQNVTQLKNGKYAGKGFKDGDLNEALLKEESNESGKNLDSKICDNPKSVLCKENVSGKTGEDLLENTKYSSTMRTFSSERICPSHDKVNKDYETEDKSRIKKVNYKEKKIKPFAFNGSQQKIEFSKCKYVSQGSVDGETSKILDNYKKATNASGTLLTSEDVISKNTSKTKSVVKNEDFDAIHFQADLSEDSENLNNTNGKNILPFKEVMNNDTCSDGIPERRLENIPLVKRTSDTQDPILNVLSNNFLLDSESSLKHPMKKKLDETESNCSDQNCKFVAEKKCKRNVERKNYAAFLFDFQNSNCVVTDINNNSFIAVARNKNVAINDRSLKSLKNVDASNLRNMHGIKFVGFLKHRFSDSDCSMNKNRKQDLLSSSRVCKMENSILQRNTNFIENVITVSPEVMYTYMRNKQALKMNHSLEVQVHFFLSDFFSHFELVNLIPEMKSVIVLSLNDIIRENLFHALPILLEVLSFLLMIHLPWNHDSLKKFFEMFYRIKGTKKFKFWMSYKKTTSQNCAHEVLKCWDILSSYFTK